MHIFNIHLLASIICQPLFWQNLDSRIGIDFLKSYRYLEGRLSYPLNISVFKIRLTYLATRWDGKFLEYEQIEYMRNPFGFYDFLLCKL